MHDLRGGSPCPSSGNSPSSRAPDLLALSIGWREAVGTPRCVHKYTPGLALSVGFVDVGDDCVHKYTSGLALSVGVGSVGHQGEYKKGGEK